MKMETKKFIGGMVAGGLLVFLVMIFVLGSFINDVAVNLN